MTEHLVWHHSEAMYGLSRVPDPWKSFSKGLACETIMYGILLQ